jgi:transcriptional regulator with XRE-family HTH domain
MTDHACADPAPPERNPPPLGDFSSDIGDRLRALMAHQGRSLEKLAEYTGLGQRKIDAVASGDVPPSINLLWRIANALGVPLGSLISAPRRQGHFVLRKAREKVISSSDGRLTSRALFPHDSKRLVEFYELTIAPGHAANCEAHAPGTRESVIVVRGKIEITAGREPPERLGEGDAMVFDADVPHTYRNLDPAEALIHLVMSYIELGDA